MTASETIPCRPTAIHDSEGFRDRMWRSGSHLAASADPHDVKGKPRPTPSDVEARPATDRAAVERLVARKEELSLKLGSRVLTLGYRKHGRQRLVVRPLQACADHMLYSENGGSYERKPAWIETSLGAEASARQALESAATIEPPKAQIGILSEAEVTAGVVTTRDGRTAAESLMTANGLDRFGPFARDALGRFVQDRQRFSVQRRLRGVPAVLLKQPLDDDYGRWLVDGLPRLALIEDHFDLQRLTFIVSAVPEPLRGVFEDSLALFGIRPEQIVEAGDETLIVETLIYPSPLTDGLYTVAPRCIDVLEQVATRVRANPAGFQRLYVSNGPGWPASKSMIATLSSPSQGIGNEPEVIAVVKKHGFTVVEPDCLSLFQQIGLFRQARVIVGSPGPAFVNAMFSTQDLTLFALTADGLGDDVYANLMSLKDGRFVSLHGEASAHEPGAPSAVTIDVERFERMLAACLDPSSRWTGPS